MKRSTFFYKNTGMRGRGVKFQKEHTDPLAKIGTTIEEIREVRNNIEIQSVCRLPRELRFN